MKYVALLLLLFDNANVIHHFSERRVFAGENTKGAHCKVYKFKTSVISSLTKFIYFSFLRTALSLRLD